MFFGIFVSRNPKMKKCVWTAQAWVDCMCGLPEEHLFSFSLLHWYIQCMSVCLVNVGSASKEQDPSGMLVPRASATTQGSLCPGRAFGPRPGVCP